METRRKMKLGTSDKVILGIGYTVVLFRSFCFINTDPSCIYSNGFLYGSKCTEQSGNQPEF